MQQYLNIKNIYLKEETKTHQKIGLKKIVNLDSIFVSATIKIY